MKFGGQSCSSGLNVPGLYYYQQPRMLRGAIRPSYADDPYNVHSEWVSDGRDGLTSLADWQETRYSGYNTDFGPFAGWYAPGTRHVWNSGREGMTRDPAYVPFQSLIERDGRHAYHPGPQAYPRFNVSGARARSYDDWRIARPVYTPRNATFSLQMRDAPDYGSIEYGQW